jgi:hypothetical protein
MIYGPAQSRADGRKVGQPDLQDKQLFFAGVDYFFGINFNRLPRFSALEPEN